MNALKPPDRVSAPRPAPLAEIFLVFLRLGLVSFGGPVAHLGYFHAEFVRRRKWLDDSAYTDLVALSQFLPGPASSQAGFAIGLMRGGPLGALAAFAGFTAPSALLMLLAALGNDLVSSETGGALVHGLKLVAVAVVAQAILGMARTLAPDGPRAGLAFAALAAALLISGPLVQLAIIAVAAAAGWLLLRAPEPTAQQPARRPPSAHMPPRGAALAALAAFALLLVALPPLAAAGGLARVADIFYRTGALVFGGGHVMLPLLQTATVDTGAIANDVFLAGYGAAQALPGPLSAFAAYLGALMPGIHPLAGAGVALVFIFLPGFLLVYGALPFWQVLRASPHARAMLAGVNAAVVGLLGAAFYGLIWTSSVRTPLDFVLAAGAFLLLTVGRQGSGRVVLVLLAATLAAHFAGLL